MLYEGKMNLIDSLEILTFGFALLFVLSPFDQVMLESQQCEHEFRLPRNVRPKKYTLQIRVDVDNNIFDGNVTIKLLVIEPTTSIHLNYKDINVTWDTADLTLGSSSNRFQVVHSLNTDDRSCAQIYQLNFAEKLASGNYTLVLQFKGDIRNDSTGLYNPFFHDTLNRTRLVLTYLEPIGARSIFPCFDEPALKAKFKVHIYHAKRYKAISNMPVLGEPELVPELSNFYLTRFSETTVEMSTYLLAFVLTEDYESYTDESGMLSVYAPTVEFELMKWRIHE